MNTFIQNLNNYHQSLEKNNANGPCFLLMKKEKEAFLRLDIPSAKKEEWRGNELHQQLLTNYKPYPLARILDKEEVNSLCPSKHRLVFINGEYQALHTDLPQGISIKEGGPLSQENDIHFTIKDHNYYSSLNLAWGQGIQLNIEGNITSPLSILYIYTEDTDQSQVFPLLSIYGKKFCKASLLESHQFLGETPPSHFINKNLLIHLEAEGHLEVNQIIKLEEKSLMVNNNHFTLNKNATLILNHFALGIKSLRSQFYAHLKEKGAHIELNGLSALSKDEQQDNFVIVHHHDSHTTAQQFFKNILGGSASAIFNGLIKIHPNAQQINSEQLNKNLLLSKKAKIFTRPQLQVAADDVKCAHGATIGQLSEEEFFYLQSRGIDRSKALKILSFAFVFDILEKVQEKSFHPFIQKNLDIFFERENI